MNASQDIEDRTQNINPNGTVPSLLKRKLGHSRKNQEKKSMDISALATVFFVLVTWIVLGRWVLPWFGVPTCMGGSCSLGPPPTVEQPVERATESVRSNGDMGG
jgi:hypothetical protein